MMSIKSVLNFYIGDRIYWIRVFGFGFGLKDTRVHRLTYSQRNNTKTSVTFFGWRLTVLGFLKNQKNTLED